MNNVKQVLIPAAGTLKEQWEELVLEASKNGSIQAACEYLHLYRSVRSQGLAASAFSSGTVQSSLSNIWNYFSSSAEARQMNAVQLGSLRTLCGCWHLFLLLSSHHIGSAHPEVTQCLSSRSCDNCAEPFHTKDLGWPLITLESKCSDQCSSTDWTVLMCTLVKKCTRA